MDIADSEEIIYREDANGQEPQIAQIAQMKKMQSVLPICVICEICGSNSCLLRVFAPSR